MIGIVSDNDFSSESTRLGLSIASISPPVECEVIDIKRGRTSGCKEVPSEVRSFIASEAISGASPNELAETFGISKSSISAYKNDATSTTSYHQPDPDLKRANSAVRDRIIGPAQSKLIAAIEAITSDKLDGAKVNVASAVARDMSSIIKNMEPDAGVIINNNRVVVYKPRLREEDEYETISVNE